MENAKLFGVVEEVASIIAEQCHEILESDPTLKVDRERDRERERRERKGG